jgi:NADPH:quinone reductase-like Zn-dependent oxidoreductase
MKAVRLHEYGGPEKLVFEEDVPEPVVGDDSVLVATAATSVNPIDWKVRSLLTPSLPCLLPARRGAGGEEFA